MNEAPVAFEGCRPWTETGGYEPELLDGRLLHFHDMDLLRIEVDPQQRRVTLWFQWDPEWTPEEFRATPLARVDLDGARIVEWDEDPVEPLPAGVGREVRNLDFYQPNLVQLDSVNLMITVEVQRVTLVVLPVVAQDGPATTRKLEQMGNT